MRSVVRRAALLAALSLPLAGTAGALPYIETGDAGDHTAPQLTVGAGSLTEIDGSLDPVGNADNVDAFSFRYGGAAGALEITATIGGVSAGIPLGLFDAAGSPLASGLGAISASDLAAGSYIVELAFPPHPGPDDPPYTILLNGPEPGGQGVLFAAPEPGALWLFAAPLLALAARRFGAR
jgi:hypothetical protein